MTDREEGLRRVLARLLEIGTWLASATIALGLVLAQPRLVGGGIGLFIALPLGRLVVMFVAFLRRGDRRLALIAAAVLMIIALGGA